MTAEIRSGQRQAIFNIANCGQNSRLFSELRRTLMRRVVRVANHFASQAHRVSRSPEAATKNIGKSRNCVFTKGDDVDHLSLEKLKDCTMNAALLTVQQLFQKVASAASSSRATSNLLAAMPLGEQG